MIECERTSYGLKDLFCGKSIDQLKISMDRKM